MLRSRSWHARLGTERRCARIQEWRDRWLGDAQQRLNVTPFRTSADPVRYARYVDATLAEWDTTWAFTGYGSGTPSPRIDREVDRLCEPRDGDRITLLLYGSIH
tara:strand:- start:96 stop:407 length:312 start_codon:yes stop_codon:yes gene_type:complete